MSIENRLRNTVRASRVRMGWSQADLASRAGLSRTGISAIETGRLVPSTAAALAIASAMDTTVESLFQLAESHLAVSTASRVWAEPPTARPCRYWRAEYQGRSLVYPVETSSLGLLPHDGIFRDGRFHDHGETDPSNSLVVASCDPAVGLLAEELARVAGVRLIVLSRSSRSALDLLIRGYVHAAGVHLARSDVLNGNEEAVLGRVRELAGSPARFSLLRVADWAEGIAIAPELGLETVAQVLRAKLRWILREPGSGARQCLEEILESRLTRSTERTPQLCARDHRGVAEAIHGRWADAGVCLELTGAELGLTFLNVRKEAYDLCFAGVPDDDWRLAALVRVVRSDTYRRLLGELPGYDTTQSGELRTVRSDASLSRPPRLNLSGA